MQVRVDGPKTAEPSFGLRQQVLSPLETLAQSVSAIAPSTSAALTVPLVCALAGEGTCLAYAIAMGAILLVALCIVPFAKQSASPGSLYTYARSTLPPACAAATAWSLCFAYVLTASSVIGGFVNFVYIFLGASGQHISPTIVAALGAGAAMGIAFYDIQISARLMLWVEAISVCLIVFVLALTLWRHGLHIDAPQLRLRGMSPSGVRLGVMLAIFSFVGFESATSLGTEAKDPLRTIPRAVLWSALLSGIFFIVSAYSEVLGFRGVHPGLGDNTAPLRLLAQHAGVSLVGPVIDAGVLVSMFAATLACIIAAARLLMLMAHHGIAGSGLSTTSAERGTPGRASLLSGVLAFLPVALLLHCGVTGADVYGYMGSLAVLGFLTAYGLVAIAAIVRSRRQEHLRIRTALLSALAVLAMIAALLGTLFPVPPAPYRFFPYIFVAYMLGALLWSTRFERKNLS